jgi:superoxide dismutase
MISLLNLLISSVKNRLPQAMKMWNGKKSGSSKLMSGLKCSFGGLVQICSLQRIESLKDWVGWAPLVACVVRKLRLASTFFSNAPLLMPSSLAAIGVSMLIA